MQWLIHEYASAQQENKPLAHLVLIPRDVAKPGPSSLLSPAVDMACETNP